MQLTIDVGSDPITGRMCNGDNRWQPFTGWIELVAAIEAARTAAAASDGGQAGVENGAKL
jgi:hypothetical protein